MYYQMFYILKGNVVQITKNAIQIDWVIHKIYVKCVYTEKG